MRKVSAFSARQSLGVILCLSCSGCDRRPIDDAPPPPELLEPKREVVPPPAYQGPIDPRWPPSHPVDPKIEIEASRLVRLRLEADRKQKDVKQAPAPALAGDAPDLHVERGELGGFHYLEVIWGRMRFPDDPMPLIVLLHGRGDRPRIPAGPFQEGVPVRLFIPQAPDALGDGYTWLATWTNSGDTQLLTRSLSARADQLAPVIAAFSKLRPTLGRPLLVGFSQGGIMTLALATRYPRRFGGAFPIAGWLPPALYPQPKKGQRFPYIYAQHGGSDAVVPTEKGRATVRALRARGLRVDYREEAGAGHVVTPRMDGEARKAMIRIVRSYRGAVPVARARN